MRNNQINNNNLNKWDYILPIEKSGQRIGVYLWVFFAFVLIPCILPTIYLFLWSFMGTDTIGILSDKLTFKWYKKVLFDPAWLHSIIYSTTIAIIVSIFSCAVLTIHLFFTRYYGFMLDRIGYLFTIIPVLFPAIIYALALKIFATKIGLNEKFTIFIGQFAFILPLQFFVLESAQDRIPDNVLFSGSLLGASSRKNLLYVFIPMLWRGLLSSFWIGFFYSFDEIIIATFIIDSSDLTVPRKLLDELPRSMTPDAAVVGTFLFILYFLTITIILYGRKIYSFIINILEYNKWDIE